MFWKYEWCGGFIITTEIDVKTTAYKQYSIQLSHFDEVNTCYYPPDERIATVGEVRGRYTFMVR
jgi:hypothetical protein